MANTLTKATMVKKIWSCIADDEVAVKKLARKYDYRTLYTAYAEIRRRERLIG